MSPREKLALGAAVTVVCVAAALWGFDGADLEHAGASFRRADYRTLPVLLALVAGFFWLKAVRWALLLMPLRPAKPLTAANVVPAMMIGFAGNNVLPAYVGEFVRLHVLVRQYGLSKAAVFASIVLERICDVAAVLVILAWGLAAAPGTAPEARTAGQALAIFAAVSILGLGVYANWTAWFLHACEKCLSPVPILPTPLKRKALDLLGAGAPGVAALRSGRIALAVALTSLAHWMLCAASVHVALQAFEIDRPPAVSVVVLGVVVVGQTIPSTPGFFGVIQVAFRLSLLPFGVSAADAVAVSVYWHLVQWMAVTLAGLYFLQRTGLRFSRTWRTDRTDGADDLPGKAVRLGCPDAAVPTASH